MEKITCEHGESIELCKWSYCNWHMWEKDFVRLHYEPEHEKGQTCWCEPKSIVKDGILHIEHNPNRQELIAFIKENFAPLKKPPKGLDLESPLIGERII